MVEKPRKPTRSQGFTLTELLVVIVVISLLASLGVAALQRGRESARRMQCQSNLRQIGFALNQYLDLRGPQGKYPDAATLPSITPELPTLYEVLASFVEDNQAVFACPSDSEYQPKEGLSYEYPAIRLANRTCQQALKGPFGTIQSSAMVWVAFDFAAFHGSNGQPGSRNFLYADGHVDAE